MIKKGFLILVGFSLYFRVSHAQSVTDIDGNIYNTIILGTQTWFKENIKTTHFNNGDAIPTTSLSINNDSSSVYQWAYNQDSLNIPIYGCLYTWYVMVDPRNICPSGWHVPSDTEWTSLANYLGGDTIAGDRMKEIGTTHWSNTSFNVTNSSDFSALPGGFRGNSNVFLNINSSANFWSSTPWGSNSFQRAITFNLEANSSALNETVAVANCGLSVRCIKNMASSIGNLLHEEKIKLFPNPTNNKINITFEEIENFNISIYDLTGTLYFQRSFSEETLTVDLNFLSKGIYFIKIVSKNSNSEKKLIVE